MEELEQLFKAEVEFVKSDGDGKRIVRGYASTENLDQQGEELLQDGLDFSPLLKSGFLNYDHQAIPDIGGVRMPVIVGYPTKAERRDRGWWVEGELLKSEPNPSSHQLKVANELWELGLALQKSGRRSLAYSVEGSVIERRGSKIVKAQVKHLAVTTKPVNADCTIEVFAKSFCCGKCTPGHRFHVPGHNCHDIAKAMSTESAAPLMRENLDRGLTSALYGQADCDCYDKASGRFKKGAAGALDHLTGCCAQPQKTALRFLRGLVQGSSKRPDIAALVRLSGIAG